MKQEVSSLSRPGCRGRRPAALALALSALISLVLFQAVGCRGVRQPADPLNLVSSLPIRDDLNVVVVSFDALRPDVLGVYGSDRGASPHIDEFANEAVVFENAYTVAPVTPTSFAAVFSGFLPTRVFHAWKFKPEVTLASRFSDAGFTTAAFVNNVQLAPERGFDHGFDAYNFRRNDPDPEQLEAVQAWLAQNSDRQFFLWVHFLNPHAPYDVNPNAGHLYREPYVGRFAETSGNTFETTDEREIARLKDLYYGEVFGADQIFGELVDSLRDLGLLRSSIVVLTSDHGEEFAEHGGFQHGRVYEEHLRIPFILRHPDSKGGRATDLRVRNVDLLPTLLHLVGHPVEDALDGTDLVSPPTARQPPVIAISMTGAHERWISVLEGHHKLILDCMPERALHYYDFRRDPGETHDVYPDHRKVATGLFRDLGAALGGPPCQVMTAAVRGKSQTVGMDEKSLEAMKALGYIQ